MRKLSVFNTVSIDGYFTDENNSIDWAHKNADDPEWQKFVAANSTQGGVLVFGRKTYEMMKSFWPTPQAKKQMPDVAEAMNSSRKIVFSRSLARADWDNTTLVKTEPVDALRRMKSESGEDLVILGSGSIVAQLAPAGLIDGCTLIVHPTVLGKGRTMFEGVTPPLALQLTGTRKFRNGSVVMTYEHSATTADLPQRPRRPQRAKR